MTDDETLAASRGAQAESELRETEAAFKEVRAGLLESIAMSSIGDSEFREKCFFAVQTLDAVRSLLQQVAAGKSIAQHNDLIRDILSGADRV